MTTHARDGYRFYSVSTPSIFREIELPARDADMTPRQRKQMASLERDAERHGTYVHASPYELG